MKHFVVVVLLAMVLAVPVMAETSKNGQFVITAEDLTKMEDADRNRFMSVYNKAQARKNNLGQPVAVTSESVQEGINFLSGIDFESLSSNGVKLADAIVAFCTRLGVGVEKFVTSSFGIVVTLAVAYKMGMIGAIVDTVVCGIGLMLFTYILFALNTSKKVKVTTEGKDDNGKLVVTSTKEEMMPRFNAAFARFTGNEKNDNEIAEVITVYRVLASIICTVVIFILIWII